MELFDLVDLVDEVEEILVSILISWMPTLVNTDLVVVLTEQ